MKKLAIITTHPIQYNAPWFTQLAQLQEIELKVFYTWSQSKEKVKDRTFGKEIQWDIPLLNGYNFEFIDNKAKHPGTHHFFGINNPDLLNSIIKFQPQAILVFGWNFLSHLHVIRYFKGKIPVWFRGDSTLIDELPGLKIWLRRIVLRWIYSHVDKAFYVGTANKLYFLKHGMKEEQLVYAPHAVDNDRFKENSIRDYDEEAQVWRKQLGFSNEEIVIVYAGKFEDKKQPLFLMKAVIDVNKTLVTPLKLILVGNGPLEDEVKSLANAYNFLKIMPFVNQSQMPVVYRLGEVFCLPSKGPGETWGLAVNEAMASGRPVIVSNKVGCSADLVNDYNGWVFKFDSIKDLEFILLKLNKTELKQKGYNAARKIESWSYSNIVKSLVSNMKVI